MNQQQIHEWIKQIVTQLLQERLDVLPQRKRLLVVHPNTNLVAKQLELLRLHYIVDEWNSKPMEEILLFSYDYCLFLEVDQQLLVSGAIGLTNGNEAKLLSELLLRDEKVLLVPQDSFYKTLYGSVQNAYLKMLHGYIDLLQQFGCSFCQFSNVREHLEMVINDVSLKEERCLITETFIEQFKGDTLHLSQHAIITPLALDVAKLKGISLKYE